MQVNITVLEKIFLSLIILLLAGCASDPQPPQSSKPSNKKEQSSFKEKPPSDGAYIYLLRESEFHGSLSSWPVLFNGKEIGSLTSEGYILIKTNPGTKEIKPHSNFGILSGGVESFQLQAKEGESYYLRHKLPGMFESDIKFILLPKEEGENLISHYKHLKTYSDYKPSKKIKPCKYWNPQIGIKNEEKAYKEISQKLLKMQNESIDKGLKRSSAIPIKGRRISVNKILKITTILQKIDNGQYKKAAEDVSSEAISYVLPIAGEYKAVLDTTKTAIDSILLNWMEDLYSIQSYRWLLDRINKEVLTGYKNEDPYYPTLLLERSSPIYNEMLKRERAIYIQWKNSDEYYEDFFASKKTAGIWARLRQKFGHEPKPVEIFKLFYTDIINNQRGFITRTYTRVMQDKLSDEADNTKILLIKSVCQEALE